MAGFEMHQEHNIQVRILSQFVTTNNVRMFLQLVECFFRMFPCKSHALVRYNTMRYDNQEFHQCFHLTTNQLLRSFTSQITQAAAKLRKRCCLIYEAISNSFSLGEYLLCRADSKVANVKKVCRYPNYAFAPMFTCVCPPSAFERRLLFDQKYHGLVRQHPFVYCGGVWLNIIDSLEHYFEAQVSVSIQQIIFCHGLPRYIVKC